MTIRVGCNTLTFQLDDVVRRVGLIDIVRLYAGSLVAFSCAFGTRYIKKTRVGESIGQEQKLFYEEDRTLGAACRMVPFQVSNGTAMCKLQPVQNCAESYRALVWYQCSAGHDCHDCRGLS